MKRLLAVTLLVAACSTAPAAVQVVDGYRLGTVATCDGDPTCTQARAIAEDAYHPAAAITRVAFYNEAPPEASSGQLSVFTIPHYVAVFDLADGSRHAVQVVCLLNAPCQAVLPRPSE